MSRAPAITRFTTALLFWRTARYGSSIGKYILRHTACSKKADILVPGTSLRAFDSKLGRFGILICEDLWHLSLPYLLAADGAEAICVLTASPTRLGGESKILDNQVVNHEHHRTYARLLNIYILFSNRVGFEDGVNFWGGSAVTAPDGAMIKTAQILSEEIIYAPLHSLEVQRARRFSRHFLDERTELVLETLQRLLKSKE